MQVFVVHNPKKGYTWVFDNHDAALRCREDQKLTQEALTGCTVSQKWQDGQPVRTNTTAWPNDEAGDCKSPNAGLIPAAVSNMPRWLEWIGSRLLIGYTRVRLLLGAPIRSLNSEDRVPRS